jgi:ATP phosphoribosyltransferase
LTVKKYVLALPKGRILEEAAPLLAAAGLTPDPEFFNDASRALRFSTSRRDVEAVRVRSFDVPVFVASGGAALGVAGRDVLLETAYDGVYAPVDLGIGKCRLSVAAQDGAVGKTEARRRGYITVATKYPRLATEFYAKRGVRAECVKLHGAMELAPLLGMCDRIVDLVSTGRTLRENGLFEVEKIMDVTSYLLVNRACYKLWPEEMNAIIRSIEGACSYAPR